MREPCLVVRGGLASKACAELQHPHTRPDINTANRFVELLDPTAGYWVLRCIESHRPRLGDDEAPSRKAI
jgi:hypothetical protein